VKRLRSFLPLLVLIAVGIALLSTGALNRFRPETLASEQARLQAQIALHPVLAGLAQIGATTLAIATGVPGVLVLILAACCSASSGARSCRASARPWAR
jgi:hypothetical protein